MTALRPQTEPTSIDSFLGGMVTLVQPRKGHRAGLDAALLQALVPAGAGGSVLDLGTGVGTAAFSVAARVPGVSVVGVERDAELVACGREALARPENASFAARVRLVEGDATDPALLRGQSFDFVLTNPPFNPERRGTASPDPRRREAHVAPESLFRSWTGRAADLLRTAGTFGLVYRAALLAEALDALSPRFGQVRILPVHPSAEAAASRVLISAKKGSRAPLELLPSFVLHQPDGTWTERADAILRGRAELDL